MRWYLGAIALAFTPVHLFADAASGSAGDTIGISTLVVQVGLSGIFLWQWRSERDQRVKRDDQVIAILEKQGPVLAEAIDTLKAVQASQFAVVSRSGSDWERLMEKLSDTTTALKATLEAQRGSGT